MKTNLTKLKSKTMYLVYENVKIFSVKLFSIHLKRNISHNLRMLPVRNQDVTTTMVNYS